MLAKLVFPAFWFCMIVLTGLEANADPLDNAIFSVENLQAQQRACSSYDPIFIDIGHSIAKPGPSDPFGMTEFEHNRRFVEILSVHIFQSALGRPIHILGLDGKAVDLSAHYPDPRQYLPFAGIYISIHHDAIDKIVANQTVTYGKSSGHYIQAAGHNRIRGWTLYISRRNGANAVSLKAANFIGAKLNEFGLVSSAPYQDYVEDEFRFRLNERNNIYRYDDLYVLRHQSRPAVLLEMGFLNSPNDVRQFYDLETMNRAARAIALAIQSMPCAQPGLISQPDRTSPVVMNPTSTTSMRPTPSTVSPTSDEEARAMPPVPKLRSPVGLPSKKWSTF